MNDGYTLNARVGMKEFQYRPVLRADRDWLLSSWRRMSQSFADKSIRNLLSSQIVDSLQDNLVYSIKGSELEMILNVVLLITAPTEGEWSPTWEEDQAKNLREGIALELNYPKLAFQSCEQCLKYWVDPIDGTVAKRGGKPVLRPEDAPPLCKLGKCPKGSPKNPKTLSPRNRMAYRSYLQDKATGYSNPDPIARKNAVIIDKAINDSRNARPLD